MRGRARLFFVVVAIWSAVIGFGSIADADTGATRLLNEPIRPLKPFHDLDPREVALGKRLFNETLLSADNTMSCGTCHILSLGGVDGARTSTGIRGAIGPINAPTVYNAAYNLAQFWDGRAEDLVEQAGGPVTNPIEMGSAWPDVIAKLQAEPDYVAAFAALYPDGITQHNVQAAIATYEKTLVTLNAPFDRWLMGEEGALTDEEKAGYALFKDYGCAACHQGANVGGNMYQVLGAIGDYFTDRGEVAPVDLGRFNVTRAEEDMHVFKVPSLRLAALTPPYFHDGSRKTLEEAVRTMAHYQLGRTMPDEDVRLITTFIRSLVGEHPDLNP